MTAFAGRRPDPAFLGLSRTLPSFFKYDSDPRRHGKHAACCRRFTASYQQRAIAPIDPRYVLPPEFVALVRTQSCVDGFLAFRSDVTINPRVRLDTNDPFSTLFTITNEGFFSIEDVGFSCHMNYVEIHNYRFAVQDVDGSTDPKGEPSIEARKSQDVACKFGAIGVPIKPPPNSPPPEYHVADITLTVSYHPHFWWRRTQSERFIGRTNGHGKIIEWSHQAG